MLKNPLTRMFGTLLVSALMSFCWTAAAQSEPAPLTCAHSHNDYEHPRPLLDALDQGFCSVEADIFLVQGKLLVAHDLKDVQPERTLEALYLEPLRNRVLKNGGRVYRGGPTVSLLIDIKTPWETTYPALRRVLESYKDILAAFGSDESSTNAVLVVISGNRSRDMFAGESIRYAGLDGQLADLKSGSNASLVPWISTSWHPEFRWDGSGEMPGSEREKLRKIVAQAHQQGRRVRFWGAPDKAAFWAEMLACGVDLINTDDLPGLRKFLLERNIR